MIMTSGLSSLFGASSDGFSNITLAVLLKTMNDKKPIVFADYEASFNPNALLQFGLELRQKNLADARFMIGNERLERRAEPR